MDFRDATNLGKEVTVEVTKTYFVDKSTVGVTCVKLHPAPIAHDLCLALVWVLSLFIEAS